MILCAIGGTEIILICVVTLLIFGGKKIPELMKGLGQGVRSFKKGMSGDLEETEHQTHEKTAEDKYKEREAIKAEIIKQKEKEELEKSKISND